jgi:ATP-dependent protease ClpP protease subunit
MKTLYLKGIIGLDIKVENLKKEVNLKSTEKLRIIVNSAGGLVFEAYEIYDFLKLYKGEIEFVIMPYAASAMSYLVMAGKRISGFKNSIWMAHRVQTIAIGDADDMLLEAKIMQGLENSIIEAYQTRLPGTKEEILQRMKQEIWGIGWEQLTEMGILDDVIDSVEDIDVPEEIKEDIEVSLQEAKNTNINNIIAMRIKKIESKLRDEKIDYKNAYERIAAKLNINESNAGNSAEDKILITEEDNMNLQEFLKSNPEAKAEYDESLRTAMDKGRDEAVENSDSVKEQKRIFDILECSGIQMSVEVAKAINDGTEASVFAMSELKRQRENRSKTNSIDFGKLVENQLPGDQDKEGKEEAQGNQINAEEFDKKSDELANEFFGGAK